MVFFEFTKRVGINLFDPESFGEVMASDNLKSMTPIRKHGLTKAYRCFLSHNKIKADIPKVKIKRRIPYIPPKEHQDQLFSSLSKQMATFCFTLQATAARPIEALRIEWDDIDKPHKRININHPAKGGNCRSIAVSEALLDLIHLILSLPRLNGKKSLLTKQQKTLDASTDVCENEQLKNSTSLNSLRFTSTASGTGELPKKDMQRATQTQYNTY